MDNRSCWKERLLNFLQGGKKYEVDAATEDWRMLGGLALLCGILGILAWLLETTALLSGAWLILLYVLSMLAGGWDALQDVRVSLPKGKLDIHFLMVAVALGAASIGAWNEGVLLLFLFSLSGALEAFAFDRTRKEIDSLFQDTPETALRRDAEGIFIEVPIESLVSGELIQIKPGAIFPVDATVFSGESAADESTLTGEAHPVAKQIGDTVYSGTLNLWGTVEAEVLRRVDESAQQKVMQLIQKAQHLKASSQRFTDRFGTGYTLVVLVATMLMFFIWWLGFGIPAFETTESLRSSFYRAMTLLVVASPCALVLSIPSAILAAIAWGARHGILFRGGVAIEKLVKVDLVCFDKTGTLTTGEMSVARIESFPPGRELEAAQLAYSLEAQGSHPIGQAIQRYGEAQGLELDSIEGFRAVSGMGVEGYRAANRCLLGRRALFLEGPMAERVRGVPEPSAELVENWVSCGDLVARILLKDTVRKESRGILERLRSLGIQTVMLTGDRRETAEAVAQVLGIETVKAELRPEDKVAQIETFTNRGYKVAMLGDGVNDAPGLAAAYVSVAMGIRGSDAALEQSEVVLMRDQIDHFLAARALSEKATRVIRQNVTIALGTVLLMTLAAVGGMIPLSVGVVAHEGSSALVCLNSLRLLFLRRLE
ncbi:MAG: Zinc-transporting ATPase [Opitutia bacterium UBA7350]|nr:MAG: Zinc-transporting ATPase [Opitutae bacterium UBA7350]